ncbi:MAG: glycoside hydrolase family 44 protein, partial [Bryobacteraceae bacterium]
MRRISPVAVMTLTGFALAFGQQAGPALSIDAAANRHVISPDIYGINFFWYTGDNDHNPDPALLAAGSDVRATTRRWGGNGTSTYHWKFDVNNIDADWFYEVLPDTNVNASKLPEGSVFNRFADRTRITGGKMIGTIPVLGWLPKARQEMCSFDVSKYGKQCKQDPYASGHPITCGNGIVYVDACGDPSISDGKGPSNPTYVKADPNDAYAPADENLQADWVRYLVTRYGKANQGGVTIYALDNEPIWWDSTHRDIHPDPYSYDELLAVNTRYAAAIKKADPTALVSGPVSDNFSSLWLSKKDISAGWARGNWFLNQVDRTAHGGMALMPWYLDQMRQYEQAHGTRLLDYLDVHAYLHPSSV